MRVILILDQQQGVFIVTNDFTRVIRGVSQFARCPDMRDYWCSEENFNLIMKALEEELDVRWNTHETTLRSDSAWNDNVRETRVILEKTGYGFLVHPKPYFTRLDTFKFLVSQFED